MVLSRIMQASQIEIVIVTLRPSGRCSTIKFAILSHGFLSVALLHLHYIVQFSRCARQLFGSQIETLDSHQMLRFDLNGGDSRVRTGDLLLARQALSQLSYIPDFRR